MYYYPVFRVSYCPNSGLKHEEKNTLLDCTIILYKHIKQSCYFAQHLVLYKVHGTDYVSKSMMQ